MTTPGRPCGTHLAFSLSDPNENSIALYLERRPEEARRITGEMFDESDPAWDPDGNYLYYLSDREFAPQVGRHRVELPGQPLDEPLCPGPPQGREKPVSARERRGQDRSTKKPEEEERREKGKERNENSRSAQGQGTDRDRLRRPGRSGRPSAGAGRQLRGLIGHQGALALHAAQGRSITVERESRSPSCGSSPSPIARRQPWPTGSAATRCRPTARRSW